MRVDIGRDHAQPMQLLGEDVGFGTPVVLVHGWPVSSIVWEKQVPALLDAGHRVITYDRRGFGRSARPTGGYDIDTLAEDLQRVVDRLDLAEFALVGFGMGCSEIVRLLANRGSDRVRRVVLIGPMQPLVDDSVDGATAQRCDGIRKALRKDRCDFFEQYMETCYQVQGVGMLGSPALRRAHWNDAVASSAHAMVSCVDNWPLDFRDDLPRIAAPTLVIHGEGDRLLPVAAAGRALADGIGDASFLGVADAPHGLLWTHADEVNGALIDFLR